MPNPTVTPRFAAAALLAAALLTACTPRVNLASRRRAYDSYLDVGSRCAAVASEDEALLKDLLQHSSSPGISPYPLLGADVGAMKRQVELMRGQEERLEAFLRDYDELAQGRLEVTPGDGGGWESYQALEARFRPLGESVKVAQASFNQAEEDFQSLLKSWHVGHADAAALRQEVDGFQHDLDQGLDGMETQTRQDRDAMAQDAANGVDRRVMRMHRVGLEHQEQALLDAEAFQRKASASARLLRDSLPEEGPIYSGPGLPGDGQGIQSLRDDEDELRRLRDAFYENRSEMLQGQGPYLEGLIQDPVLPTPTPGPPPAH